MNMNFRHEARNAIDNANAALNSNESVQLKYAALELRMAMEALTYDRIKSYSNEIPPEEYKTWQPRKVLSMLLKIDPMADTGGLIKMGLQEKQGTPSQDMKVLGTDNPIKLSTIKKHYDALGAYLHLPTYKQIENNSQPNIDKLRSQCNEIIKDLETVLSSMVFNFNLHNSSSIDCFRCNKKIRKRIPLNKNEIEAKCFECGAEYSLSYDGESNTIWKSKTHEIACPTEDCDKIIKVWNDKLKPNTNWKCDSCNIRYILGIGVYKLQDT